jgi:hypothetical protein
VGKQRESYARLHGQFSHTTCNACNTCTNSSVHLFYNACDACNPCTNSSVHLFYNAGRFDSTCAAATRLGIDILKSNNRGHPVLPTISHSDAPPCRRNNIHDADTIQYTEPARRPSPSCSSVAFTEHMGVLPAYTVYQRSQSRLPLPLRGG